MRWLVSCLLLIASLQLSRAQRTFGAGLSQVQMTHSEQVLLNYTLSSTGLWGVVNNWWVTGGDRGVLFSFYVDGESLPSIQVVAPVACGNGFGVEVDPPAGPVNTYSSMFFSKAANTSGYANKFPIPFQRSILVTYKSSRPQLSNNMVWLWVRGTENTPILPQYGMSIPPTARMSVQQIDKTIEPLEFVDIIEVPAGKQGMLLASQLTVVSETPNVLEGCYYLFPDAHTTWESNAWSVLATGTEDYFESAFYWDGGVLAQPYVGVITREAGPPVKISTYKIHSPLDPLVFSDGIKLKWRIGDMVNAQNQKCTCPPGALNCQVVGDPRPTQVLSYAWVLTW